MARRIRISWVREAEEDLDGVRRNLRLRADPDTARSVASRIIAKIRKLRDFPEIGSPVEDVNIPNLREVFVASYRILYRYRRPIVEIVAVRHAARNLTEGDLPSE
jgi:plasmid stabilization system protein ParE